MLTKDHLLLAKYIISELYPCFFRNKIAGRIFVFGCISPDVNPFSYMKRRKNTEFFLGHNYINTMPYIKKIWKKLRNKNSHCWNLWDDFQFGRMIHYVADAFTFPHNQVFHGNSKDHSEYEKGLHKIFKDRMNHFRWDKSKIGLRHLHYRYECNYMEPETDCNYIMQAVNMVMKSMKSRQCIS